MIKNRIQIDIEKFRKRREKDCITVTEIAHRMGVVHRTVYLWISNGWPDGTPSMFNALAKSMGTTRQSLRRSIQEK